MIKRALRCALLANGVAVLATLYMDLVFGRIISPSEQAAIFGYTLVYWGVIDAILDHA